MGRPADDGAMLVGRSPLVRLSLALMLGCGLSLGSAGCAGVSPRPDAVSPDDLPTVELSAADQERVARLVEQCVSDVVQRRYSEAEVNAVAVLELDPRSARARSVRGLVLLQAAMETEPTDLFLANEGEAETVLAEKLAPADPFVGWARALFLAETGHLSAAAAAAEAALQRTRGAPSGERAELLGLAGTYRYELGEERAAQPLLQAYLGLRPDDATANFRIGSCLLRMAMLPTGPLHDQARAAQSHAELAALAFERCAELAPGDEDAALAIGAARMLAAQRAKERARGLGDEQRALMEAASATNLESAIEQFRAAGKRFPASAEAMFRVGVAEEERGDPAAARQAYEMALQRDADHLGSLLNLAALSDPAGAEAAGYLQRALVAGGAGRGLSADEVQRIEALLAKR